MLYTKKINIPITLTTIYISLQHLPYHFIRLSLRFFWLILLLHYANLTTEMSYKNIRGLALQVTLSSLIHYQSGKWPYIHLNFPAASLTIKHNSNTAVR